MIATDVAYQQGQLSDLSHMTVLSKIAVRHPQNGTFPS